MPSWSKNTETCGICGYHSQIIKECSKCGKKGCAARDCMGGHTVKSPCCQAHCKISKYKPINNRGKPHV